MTEKQSKARLDHLPRCKESTRELLGLSQKQAQALRNLDRADRALRMAGVSNLGMSAIEQKGFRQIRKLSRAVWKYQCAWFDLKWAKKGQSR